MVMQGDPGYAERTFARTVAIVAALNLAYFGIEFSVALSIRSVSLFADSIDFLEDASLNILVLLALGMGAVWRARIGMLLAALLLLPGMATLWAAWQKFVEPLAPGPGPLVLAGLGALAVNLACAFLLSRHRSTGGSLAKAAFLSARNDAIANIGIIAAGLVTAWIWYSPWPDLIVGITIAAVNAGAAFEVWETARGERKAVERA
jgi:Co/Zn/Cd efflux system component